jgi:hypothetical protein
MSEYDVDGDGYADEAVVAEYADGSSATVVDTDGDGFADVVVYEPAEAGESGYEGGEYPDAAYEGGEYPDAGYESEEVPTEADPNVSSQYFNDYTDTGVSSDGDTGYVALGDGEFYAFGDGMS